MDTRQEAYIEKAVMRTLDEYFEAARRRDVRGLMSFFVDAEEMTIIENGKIRRSGKAFEKWVVGFFEDVVELDVTGEERRVFPLSLDVAVVTGIFRFSAKTTSGDTVGDRDAFTFVFVKKGDRWQISHVHESSIPA